MVDTVLPGNPLRVLYVYHGTAGIAGAYLHGITHALSGVPDIECHLATNAYYAFDETLPAGRVKRLFFRLTENTDRNRFLRFTGPSYTRLPLRYAELAVGYFRL